MEGCAHKTSSKISDEYFNSRPKVSRISARVSQQSRIIDCRETLIERHREESEYFNNVNIVPRPDYWGGYHIVPERFEFWQGQSDRTHDRFIFEKLENGNWKHYRVQP